MIEQLDDILEELADQAEVYGACSLEGNCRECRCRNGWISEYRQRIRSAVKADAIVAALADDRIRVDPYWE